MDVPYQAPVVDENRSITVPWRGLIDEIVGLARAGRLVTGRSAFDGVGFDEAREQAVSEALANLLPIASLQARDIGPQLEPSTGTVNQLIVSSPMVWLTNAADLTINGIGAGFDGQIVTFRSVGTNPVYFAHLNGGASAVDQLSNFVTSGVTPLAAGKGSATFRYRAASQKWTLISHDQGGFIQATFNAGDFAANGAMTWTVAAGDVAADGYLVVGRALALAFRYNTTTVGGVANNLLLKTIPNGYTFSAGWDAIYFAADNAVNTTGWAFNNSATQIAFARLAGGAWTLCVDNTKIAGSLLVPIN